MARKKASSVPAPRFEGKTVVVAGRFPRCPEEAVAATVAREGGTIVENVTASVDFVVAGVSRNGGPTSAEKKSRDLVAKKGAPIRILDEADFQQFLTPTPDECLALLKGGVEGIQQWNERFGHDWMTFTVDLAGHDFRRAKLMKADLRRLTLDGANFEKAQLYFTRFDQVSGACFDEAHLEHAEFYKAIDCSFKNARATGARIQVMTGSCLDGAIMVSGSVSELQRGSARGADLTDCRLNPADFTGADCTGIVLSNSLSSYTRAPNACFDGADLCDADFEKSDMKGASFRGAKLLRTRFGETDFTGADLTDAAMDNASLSRATLCGANLTNADLSGANVSEADFTGATLDGADFTNANVLGAKFDPGAESAAKGLSPGAKPVGAAGPNVQQLAQVASQTKRLILEAPVALPDGTTARGIIQVYNGGYGSHVYAQESWSDTQGNNHGALSPGKSVPDCMTALGNRWGHATLLLDDLGIKATGCPLKSRELRTLVAAAWCEAFGLPVPTEDDLQSRRKSKAASNEEKRDEALAELRSGRKGVAAWNARSDAVRMAIGQFRPENFAGCDLSGVSLGRFDLQGSDFAGAKLSAADLGSADAKKASFRDVSAAKANFAGGKYSDATFAGADLKRCNLRGCSFLRTDFRGANLTSAEFQYSDVRGADFTDATFDKTEFEKTKFDEHTVFPAGFALVDGLHWAGAGTDPRLKEKVAAVTSAGPIDLETFMKLVAESTDASRLDNALRMLKADRFRLFAETDAAAVTGVVKSQSDPDLVYACRLDGEGQFSCCTQNLNVCGGLRGALCKHLLVLLIGLASGGALDPTTVHAWMTASRLQKPKLDKDRMSEIFLKYKGAEAGEIDWRPTETVPEDFYAF